MHGKKLFGALAVAGALAAGGVAGALLGTPTLSSAASLRAAATATAGHPGGAGHPKGPGPQLDAAATALNMSTDALRAELDAGKTIAQVATEKQVDVNKVIDAMVAAAQADLRQGITDFVNNGHPKGGPGPEPGRPGGFGPPGSGMNRGRGPGPDLDAAAPVLGMSVDELRTELRGGKSIAQVASDKRVDVNKVIDAIVAAETARIDQAVTDGKLTQADADAKKAELHQRVTDQVNHAGKPHPPR